MISLPIPTKFFKNAKSINKITQQLGQPDGGEQRYANRAVVQWPPLVTLGVEPVEHSVEPVLYRPQPEKSGEIRAEFCVISRGKLKLFDKGSCSGKMMELEDRASRQRNRKNGKLN